MYLANGKGLARGQHENSQFFFHTLRRPFTVYMLEK